MTPLFSTVELAPDGKQVNLYSLSNKNGMQLRFMDWGATWLSCQVPLADGELREVLLACDNMKDHMLQTAYFGATVGRYANRIENAKFSINDEAFQLSANPQHCLHGGVVGFDKRRWTLTKQDDSQLEFTLFSEDGDQGFPGNLDVSVTYTLTENNEFSISYNAVCDKDTHVNMTNHAYFNLTETQQDCRTHRVILNADQYQPVDNEGIPNSELKNVSGTAFDFNEEKSISKHWDQDEDQKAMGGYDHSYHLNELCANEQNFAVKVTSPDSKLSMELYTTKPAIQLYSGNFLTGTMGRNNTVYNIHAGFCLEPHYHPNSPNVSNSTSLLKAGEAYKHSIKYKFTAI